MLAGLVQIIGWLVAAAMAVVTVLLALNKQTGLRLIQHRVDMLPQVLLVRYGSLTVLALIAAWLNAPRFLSAMFVAFAAIGFGDAFIYRRAGHPFRLHLIAGGAASLAAILAYFAKA